MAIVWLEDASKLHYVREQFCLKTTRAMPIKVELKAPGRVVGYEVLPPDEQGVVPGVFLRRVYLVQGHDRCNDPGGVYKRLAPSEAIPGSQLLADG